MDKEKYIKIKHFKNLILKKLLVENIHIVAVAMVANVQVVKAYWIKGKNLERLIFWWIKEIVNIWLKSLITNNSIDKIKVIK